MNDGPEAAVPGELEEAPILRLEDLPNADLKDQDLTKIGGLLPEHLAGADLTGAKLPDEIAKFPALDQVAAISSEARKIFIGLLAACVYSWLVIGTTTDVALILNTASSPLPIINTSIPIAGFYVIGATLLAAVYGYFHFYLQRLWRTLATLPAIFPDGTPLDDRTDPWLLTNLVRADFKQLNTSPPPLTRLENLLTILVAWWLVPLTLLALWARYLPAHYWLGTTWLVALLGITAVFGRHSYRLARATLRGQTPEAEAEAEDSQGVSRRAWHEFRQIRPDRLTVVVIAVLTVCSLSAFHDNPRASYTWLAEGLNAVGVQAQPVVQLVAVLGLAEGLNAVRVRTYADLREVSVAERPDGWDGKEWGRVKRVDLRDRNLAFADAASAFLANVDLRGANLTSAELYFAQLQGADLTEARVQGARLYKAELQGANLYKAELQSANLPEARVQGASLYKAELQRANLSVAQLEGTNLFQAQLQGADLRGADLTRAHLQGAFLRDAHLQGAFLRDAQLQGAFLRDAQLQGADLTDAQLQGADLTDAHLQGADLSYAQLQGADLTDAQLQGADLSYAQLQGADLTDTELQGADLTYAQLQGADLRSAALWRALVDEAQWDYGDLRGAHVHLISDADINTLIADVKEGIRDEENRKAVAERLNAALQTAERPARPDFPEEWRSKPDVTFNRDDPTPEPFDWGPPSWATQDAYDEDLATFLGDLACASEVREALTRGVARRASGLRVQPAGLPSDPKDDRNWPKLVAARLIGPDCPPARGLSDDMRSELEALAARRDTPTEAPEAFPRDPIE